MALLSAYRFGLAPLRTTAELQRVLPVPVYLWVTGKAGIVYPNTTRANPSTAVGLVATRPVPSWAGTGGFPVYVNGRQWQNVVVPLLQDGRLPTWKGSLGGRASSPVSVPELVSCSEGGGTVNVVVGEQSPTVEPGPGFLYAGVEPYLTLLTRLVGEYAEQAGYGTSSNG